MIMAIIAIMLFSGTAFAEMQGHNQCSAFSTAFVLRNFGQTVTGSEVYREMRFKIPVSGYVLPKGVLAYLDAAGFNSNIFRGV